MWPFGNYDLNGDPGYPDDEYMDGYAEYDSGRSYGSSRGYDPLYYYRKVKLTKIAHETNKAYLVETEYSPVRFWVPKSLCKKLNKERMTVYIQRNFFNQKCGEVYEEVKSYYKLMRNFN